MSIPERCWRCDKFNLKTLKCKEVQEPDTDDRQAMVATFSWGTPAHPNPHLIFDFHREIHPDNVKQIAEVMAHTAAKKMNCLNICDFGDADYGPSGNA